MTRQREDFRFNRLNADIMARLQSDPVRLAGLRSPMTRAEFGVEINWLVERRLSNGSRPVRPSTLRTVAKTDAFGTAAMGMWQIPAQFSCMVHTLRSALGGAANVSVESALVLVLAVPLLLSFFDCIFHRSL